MTRDGTLYPCNLTPIPKSPGSTVKSPRFALSLRPQPAVPISNSFLAKSDSFPVAPARLLKRLSSNLNPSLPMLKKLASFVALCLTYAVLGYAFYFLFFASQF